ncbi:MAG: hypothetical protein H0U50_00470 [Pyrinomonadaceae bacterium]|nr:hypothetical protein [Pyrinomonadaceae bacterium]
MTSEKLEKLRLRRKKAQELSDKLLANIKENRTEIEKLSNVFRQLEEDYVYRFYHQSFKVFGSTAQIKQAKELFERLAPDSFSLNDWFCSIADEAIGKEFDFAKTNQIWLEETRPILEAFWHSKYFLEQMLVAADELEESPQLLPSGWAAVLYLYNLR